MKLNYVIIYVEDAVKAVEFYNKAFGFKIRFVHESNMYAEMDSGETVLAFADHSMMKDHVGFDAHKGIKNCFEIAFSTHTVQKDFDMAVQNGAKELKQPEVKPWGQTVSYVQDPYGTIIEICSPMG